MNYTKILDQELLMVYAQDPADSLTKAFAGMILSTTRAGIFPPVGVSDADFIELLGAYFPGAWEVLFENTAVLESELAFSCPAISEARNGRANGNLAEIARLH